MKGIHTLIKLHKRQLDELRRRMATMENQKAQMHALIEKLQKELEFELQLASEKVEMAGFYGNFSAHIRARQEKVVRELIALDQKMGALSLEINAAFAELKKYEIARDNAAKRERDALQRKETIELDDMAADQYRRKKEES